MSYTNIPKPTGSGYTDITTEGRYVWDDLNIYWDDTNVYWDGNFISTYTNISKPSTSNYTWADLQIAWSSVNSPWSNVSYNLIDKPI